MSDGTARHTASAMDAPSQRAVLSRLFMTLFLRGRSGRSLQLKSAPRSVFRLLWTVLGTYTFIGLFSAIFYTQPLYELSVYLHVTTFMLIGMFIAASAGDVLFNAEEADILMHRPVAPQALLWAKIRLLVQIALWMAGAFNLTGFVVGVIGKQGSWLFLPAHMISTVMMALFCTGGVVMSYELCLRWFGRERLDGLMTMMQVVVSIGAVLGGQLVPQFLGRFGGKLGFNAVPFWVRLLPPAWFAGVDDVIAGSRDQTSFVLAGLAFAATALVAWFAFTKLAGDYEEGLRKLNERVSKTPGRAQRRLLDRLVRVPPLSWWLRDEVGRGSFLLTVAYLIRDRDTKLRVYPGIAPIVVLPLVLMMRHHGATSTDAFGPVFGTVFGGAYLSFLPMLAMGLITYSQNWQAADVFHIVPIEGPGPIAHGVRRAVLLLLGFPVMAVVALLAFALGLPAHELVLLLPGLVAMPVFSLIPCLNGKGIPFAKAADTTQGARRTKNFFLVVIGAGVWSAIVMVGWAHGFFWWLMLAELVALGAVYLWLRAEVTHAKWDVAPLQ